MENNRQYRPVSSSSSKGRTTICTGLAILAVLVFAWRAILYTEPAPEPLQSVSKVNINPRIYRFCEYKLRNAD